MLQKKPNAKDTKKSGIAKKVISKAKPSKVIKQRANMFIKWFKIISGLRDV